MNTRMITKSYRFANWANIIQERNESGLSIKAYCERAGIQESSYYYRLKKLRETACEELIRIQEKQPRPTPPLFAEVKLPPQPTQLPKSTPQSHVSVEISGTRITAGSEYPIDKLTEVLKAVAQTCC